jgi:hypothetical protein
VAEEKSALVATGHKARSKNGVGILVQEQLDHLQKVPRVIFEVGVMNYDELTFGVRESSANRSVLPLIPVVLKPGPVEFAIWPIRLERVTKASNGFGC